MECQAILAGNHVDRFSLAYETARGSKTILKVQAALRLQNEGIVVTNDHSSNKWTRLPQTEGFVKLIQPASTILDGKRRPPVCIFGQESENRKFDGRLIVAPWCVQQWSLIDYAFQARFGDMALYTFKMKFINAKIFSKNERYFLSVTPGPFALLYWLKQTSTYFVLGGM